MGDTTYLASRPGPFLFRVLAVAVFDLLVAGAAFSIAADAAVQAGAVAMVGLVVAVGVVIAVPTIVAITSASARVRVVVASDAVTLVPLPGSWLTPDLDVRLPLAGLQASCHQDEAATQLVLRAPDGTITLTSSDPGALERLERQLRSVGVRRG